MTAVINQTQSARAQHGISEALTSAEQQQKISNDVTRFLNGELKEQRYFFYNLGFATGYQEVYLGVIEALQSHGCVFEQQSHLDAGDSIFGSSSAGWLEGVTIKITSLPQTQIEETQESPTGIKV